MNCFCGMTDRQSYYLPVPFRESHTLWAGFELAQSLSSDLIEWSCAVAITITPRGHKLTFKRKVLFSNIHWVILFIYSDTYWVILESFVNIKTVSLISLLLVNGKFATKSLGQANLLMISSASNANRCQTIAFFC